MELNCPICSTSIASSKHVWKYDFSELLQCSHCGIIFHLRNDNLFLHQATSTYTKNSWGKHIDDDYDANMNSLEMRKHLERMKGNLQYFTKFVNSFKNRRVLDIGAGIGLLEFVAQEVDSSLQASQLVMLEPVLDNYHVLRSRFSNHTAVNCHLNQLENIEPSYDAIFCQGVDYLFENLNEAFKILHGLLKQEGFLLVSRNVFIDMPCYFGGETIKKAQDLFSPNSLINAYFLEEHYRQFLELNFDIVDTLKYEEEYSGDDVSVGVHYNYVLQKKGLHYDETRLKETKYLDEYNQKLDGLLST